MANQIAKASGNTQEGKDLQHLHNSSIVFMVTILIFCTLPLMFTGLYLYLFPSLSWIQVCILVPVMSLSLNLYLVIKKYFHNYHGGYFSLVTSLIMSFVWIIGYGKSPFYFDFMHLGDLLLQSHTIKQDFYQSARQNNVTLLIPEDALFSNFGLDFLVDNAQLAFLDLLVPLLALAHLIFFAVSSSHLWLFARSYLDTFSNTLPSTNTATTTTTTTTMPAHNQDLPTNQTDVIN